MEKWTYSFFLWVNEPAWHGNPCAKRFCEVLRAATVRCEFDWSELEFAQFQADVEQAGFTMREVTRVPYHEPEAVF